MLDTVLRRVRPHLTKQVSGNNHDEDWNNVNLLVSDVFAAATLWDLKVPIKSCSLTSLRSKLTHSAKLLTTETSFDPVRNVNVGTLQRKWIQAEMGDTEFDIFFENKRIFPCKMENQLMMSFFKIEL